MGSKDEKADQQTPADEVRHSPMGGLIWKVLSIGATVGATKLATDAAQRGWKFATGKPVPVAGDYEQERTRDVIAFTAISAMLVTGARIAAERKAAEYYRHSTGHLPKALIDVKPSKAEKKAAKKLKKAQARLS